MKIFISILLAISLIGISLKFVLDCFGAACPAWKSSPIMITGVWIIATIVVLRMLLPLLKKNK